MFSVPALCFSWVLFVEIRERAGPAGHGGHGGHGLWRLCDFNYGVCLPAWDQVLLKPLAGCAGDASSVLLVVFYYIFFFFCLGKCVFVCLIVCLFVCVWDPSLSRASSGATDVCVCVCFACAARFKHATPAPARKPGAFLPSSAQTHPPWGCLLPERITPRLLLPLSHPKYVALGGINDSRMI